METYDIFGRLLCNSHVDYPNDGVADALKRTNNPADIIDKLRLSSAQYDSDGDSKDFSASELDSDIEAHSNPITIYETDNIKKLADGMKEIDDKNNNENN